MSDDTYVRRVEIVESFEELAAELLDMAWQAEESADEDTRHRVRQTRTAISQIQVIGDFLRVYTERGEVPDQLLTIRDPDEDTELACLLVRWDPAGERYRTVNVPIDLHLLVERAERQERQTGHFEGTITFDWRFRWGLGTSGDDPAPKERRRATGEVSYLRMCHLGDRIAELGDELVRLLPAPQGDEDAPDDHGRIRRQVERVKTLRDQLWAVAEQRPPGDLIVAIWDTAEPPREPLTVLRQSWDPSSNRYRFVDPPPELSLLTERIERDQTPTHRPRGFIEFMWSEAPDGMSRWDTTDDEPKTDDPAPADPDPVA